MELVFCYITSYANIFNQGFNLGSKYIYDVDRTDGILRISRKENTKFIENLFENSSGQVIRNVTALVGENGSGKTSIIRFLKDNITSSDSTYPSNRGPILQDDYNRTLGELDDFAYSFLIFSENDKVFIKTNNTRYIKADFEFTWSTPIEGLTLFSTPILDFIKADNANNSVVDVSANNIYTIDKAEESNYIKKESDNLNIINNYNVKKRLDFIEKARTLSYPLPFNLPDKVRVSFHNNEILDNTEVDNLDTIIKDKYNIDASFFNIHNTVNAAWKLKLDELKDSKASSVRSTKDMALYYSEENKLKAEYYLWKSLFELLLRNNIYVKSGKVKDMETNNFYEILVSAINSIEDNKIQKKPILQLLEAIENLFSTKYSGTNFESGEVSLNIPQIDVKDFLVTYNNYINHCTIESFTNAPVQFILFDWSYQLSSGQLAYLDLFARFQFGVDRIDITRNKSPYKEQKTYPKQIFVLIDEGELGFHLQWQKDYIYNLLEIFPSLFSFKDENGNIYQPSLQIILTTHSPISLSDLPRYNIVYLKRQSEDGSCRVIHQKSELPNRSFGANIHDLLKDTFFLQNGFMGKFSQTKINALIKWLTIESSQEYKDRIDYAKSLIDLIDEPILKIKLRELFAKKMNLNEEIERLQAQREEINKRLEELNRQQSNDNN
ncbi:AAA family ATPase [Spirosoma knui]